MSHIDNDDGAFLDDYDAAQQVGEKVLEMAKRLLPVAKVVPGSAATYAFEMDGVTYKIVLTVAIDAQG